jgi:glyoxylase-like metal-dependent hydrolase (beta-lactamase superfamily II)
MRIEAFTVGAFQENCYLLWDEDHDAAVLVDPGAEGERLVAAVEATGAELQGIWLTHAHIDHVGGITEVRRRWPAVPIHLHPADEPLYANVARQAAAYGLAIDQPPPYDRTLAEGGEVRVGALGFRVMHAPGHAPGHVVFHGHGSAFVGDCLFAGSVGRTDLPLSDGAQLASSLERIAALPTETRVLPGHGPATTIATERESNPFLNGMARVVRR